MPSLPKNYSNGKPSWPDYLKRMNFKQLDEFFKNHPEHVDKKEQLKKR